MSTAHGDRIRVAFVMHIMQVAGAEVLVSQIIDKLKDRIEPTILCLDGIGELGLRLQQDNVPVIHLNRRSGIDRGLPFSLARELRVRKIDVVHAHQYTPFFYSALARAVGSLRTKIIFTEHGRHYPDVVSWKRKMINRWFLSRWSNRTTACCDFSANALRSKDGFAQVDTIYNGVDLQRLQASISNPDRHRLRTQLGLCDSNLYVVCIARFHPVKDHATLLRAWPSTVQRMPHARLLLVGDGPEKSSMERLAKELGVADSIQFLGIRHDIPDILTASDLFTLTSVSEAASLTLLEAMACRCPVVITDVGGNHEHVTDEVDGFLVPRGDWQTLSNRFCELLSNEEKKSQFRQLAAKKVEQRFRLDQAVDRYAEMYRQMAGAGG